MLTVNPHKTTQHLKTVEVNYLHLLADSTHRSFVDRKYFCGPLRIEFPSFGCNLSGFQKSPQFHLKGNLHMTYTNPIHSLRYPPVGGSYKDAHLYAG